MGSPTSEDPVLAELFSKFKDQLKAVGVESVEDMTLLEEADVQDIKDLTNIEKKKLMRAITAAQTNAEAETSIPVAAPAATTIATVSPLLNTAGSTDLELGKLELEKLKMEKEVEERKREREEREERREREERNERREREEKRERDEKREREDRLEQQARSAHERNLQLQAAQPPQSPGYAAPGYAAALQVVQPVVVAPYSLAWNSRLFEDMFEDPEVCLCGALFPCFLFAANQRELRTPGVTTRGFNPCVINPCDVLNWMLYIGHDALCCPFTGGAQWLGMYRYQIRTKFNLAPGFCIDARVHLFCHLCALCQEARQLKAPSAAGVVTQAPGAPVMVPGRF